MAMLRSAHAGLPKVCSQPCCIAIRFKSERSKPADYQPFLRYDPVCIAKIPARPAVPVNGQGGSDAQQRPPRQTLDLPDLCGPFDRARFERALSQEPGQGTDRALGRLRSTDPD